MHYYNVLAQREYQTAGYKPVASGSEWLPEGLRNSDALTLQQFSSVLWLISKQNPN